MEITKKLCYGVDENTPKELLYVSRIILRSYNNETLNKTFMEIMQNFKIFQYNYNKAIDSDYFMWQYINDKGEKDWKHIELSCYEDSIEGIYRMWQLYKICEDINMDIKAEIQFDDVRKLIAKIESEAN